jgi:lipopolysaccharide export system permease protein
MIKIFLNNFYLQNSKIGRYVNLKLFSIFVAILFIISFVVFGNQFVLVVRKSIESGVPFIELMPIVFFNMLRDIPLIVTLSLFLSIILSISQLYKDSEAIVMNSIGIGIKHFSIIIQPFVILVFSSMLVFTTYIIPFAKFEKNIIESKVENSSEFSFISEGEFEEFKNGDIVFFASKSNSVDDASVQNMEEIFIYSLNNNDPVIVVASEANKFINPKNQGTYLRLKNGTRYQGFPSQVNKRILEFDLYDLEIISKDLKDSISVSSTIESTKTSELLVIGDNLALSELQWRVSQPISILVLAFLGILLGQTSPRGGKGLGLIFGVVIFILYNNCLMIVKSTIENENLNPIVGLFGVHILIILSIILIYRIMNLNVIAYVDKIPFLKNY